MSVDEIKRTMQEAKRFIAKARLAIERLDKDAMSRITGCKETAACRRSSLDLMRSLAELRKH